MLASIMSFAMGGLQAMREVGAEGVLVVIEVRLRKCWGIRFKLHATVEGARGHLQGGKVGHAGPCPHLTPGQVEKSW